MEFSQTIKRLRKELLMSQEAFAEELGVAFATVNRWETGRSKPTYKTLKKLDEYCKQHDLDFDIRQLLMER